MSPLLQALMAEAADPVALDDAVARGNFEVTYELGDEAHAVFLDASQRGDHDEAQRAAIVASAVFLSVGDRSRSLAANIEVLRIALLHVPNLDGYATVREHAMSCVAMAEQLGDDELALAASVLSAESARLGLDCRGASAGERAADGTWLETMVDDVLDAARRCRAPHTAQTALSTLERLSDAATDRALVAGGSAGPELRSRLSALGSELARIGRELGEAAGDRFAAIAQRIKRSDDGE